MTTSPTSSEETVRRYVVEISVYHKEYKICTREQVEAVLASDFDVLSIERDRLRQRVTELEAVVRQYASECAECGGKGHVPDGEAVTGRGPDDVIPNLTSCPECEDIRLALSGEK